MDMKSTSANTNFSGSTYVLCALAWTCLSAPDSFAAEHSPANPVSHATAVSSVHAKTFDTPQQAVEALVDAAERFDVVTLTEIFGPEGHDIVLSGEFAQDRKHAMVFA